MVSWDPFADGFRMIERFGSRFPVESPGAGDDESGALVPAADQFEDNEGITIEVEMPGVGPQDVAVTVSSDSIVVEAERAFTRNGRHVSRLEGRYGRLRRTFELPVRAVPRKANAELRRGVLRVFVPRTAATSKESLQLALSGDDPGRSIPVG